MLDCTGCADVDVRHRTWRVLIDAPISGRLALFFNGCFNALNFDIISIINGRFYLGVDKDE